MYKRQHFASSHNQKKDKNQFKNTKQPELPENQTVWKSDNLELKKKHSSRLVKGVEMGRQEREDCWRTELATCGWWIVQSHIFVQIKWEEQLGSETDHATQGSSTGKYSL